MAARRKGSAKGAPRGRERAVRIDAARFGALLVDLDGVVTDTASVHAAAWKQLFDAFLRARAAPGKAPFVPFDIDSDYRRYVDGKPRYDGVQSFLASRDIDLPYGDPADPSDRATVCGLGNRKDDYFRERMAEHGVAVYDSSVAFIRAAKARGLRAAVVTSSRNCAAVLEAAGLTDLFETRVDGVESERLGLRGKPAPDIFLEAARRLDMPAARAVVIEDAIAGVQAGRAGGFGLVVGVDRVGQAEALRENGADVVVADLAQLSLGPAGSALDGFDEIVERLRGKRPAVFLDYDGTLTPIVARPDLAVLSAGMRGTIERLTRRCAVAVVSGRDRRDVARLVGLGSIFYAGSHGFDIAGPDGRERDYEDAARFRPALRQAEDELRGALAGIDGVLVEGKKFAIAVHFRLVADSDLAQVERAVDAAAARHPELRRTGGKKIFELRPDLDWDKGKAVLWMLDALGLDAPDVVPLYLGDDATDEDAFTALRDRGIGILVAEAPPETAARYLLRDPAEVKVFLDRLVETLG